MGLLSMFSSSKEDVKAKIEKQKGEVERLKLKLSKAKSDGRKDEVSTTTLGLSQAQNNLAALKAKLAKMK